MKYILIWLLLMNLALFFTMGSDKGRAKANKRRVPEARLFLLAVLGGALGGTLGMYVFRHKTKHWYFHLAHVFAIVWQVALWASLYGQFGF